MKPCRTLVRSVLFIVLGAAASLAGDGPELDAKAANNSPLLLLRPDAVNLGAPDWVKPGVRVTFYSASASVPENYYDLVEDSNGGWEDPATGKRYRKDEAVGAGGEGFLQLDVVAVGKTGVALQTSAYLIAQRGEPNTLLKFLASGFTASSAGPADYWVHPKLLAGATEFHTPQFFMLKGNYDLYGTQVPSLCIVTRKPDFYSSQAFDLKSGLLVASTVSSRGKVAGVRLPGEDPPRGNKGITVTRLINARQMKLPGLDGSNPEWAMRVKRMRYNGMVTIAVPGAVTVQAPAQMVATFDQRGKSWAHYTTDLQFNLGGLPQQMPGDGISGPMGGFWVDPAAYRDVKPNQVLDDDPITHIRTRIGNVAGGRFSVVVEGPGVGAESVYDANSGMLVAFSVVRPSAYQTFQFQLQATE